MSIRSSFHDGLDVDSLLLIDRYSIRFEKSLRGDSPLRIESVLAEAPDTIEGPLFAELLSLEMATLLCKQAAPPRAHYRQRFPGFGDWVDAVYDDLGLSREDEGGGIDDIIPQGVIGGLEGHIIDGYCIQERLGRGGMGVVYKALDIRLERVVALKMLSGDRLSSEQLARFRAESRALAGLDHPHILKIHAIGNWHDQPYLVLEYASGGTLADRLQSGPLDPAECLRVMATLAETASFLHERNLVHRDLKPSNILYGEDGVLKIGDFGLIRNLAEDSGITRADALLGTPAYMAPEQLNADRGEVSPGTDIYTLGVVMHHLLTGRLPYGDMAVADMLGAVASNRPAPVDKLEASGIPTAFARVCKRCLQKKPAHRYASAAALLSDIRRLRQGLGISALPLYLNWLARSSRKPAAATLAFALGAVLSWRLLWPVINPPTGFLDSELVGSLDRSVMRQLATASSTAEPEVITLLSGNVSAGTALKAAQGLAVLGDRYLAIADTLNHRVLILDLENGDIGRVAGNGDPSHAGDGGPAVNGTLNLPVGIHFGADDRLYIADRGNHAIRFVDNDGTLHTLSGADGCQDNVEPSSRPYLCYPTDIEVLDNGDYFVADSANQRIRYKRENAVLSTVLSLPATPEDRGYSPFPRAIDYHQDQVYFLDAAAGELGQIDGGGEISTLAGGFRHASALATDRFGNLYVGDHSAQPITRIDARDGETLALDQSALFGGGNPAYSVDALAVDSRGRIFFTSRSDNSLRVVIPPSNASLVAMPPRETPPVTRPLQDFPSQGLREQGSFSYIDETVKTLLTDLSARLGLGLFIESGVILDDEISMTDYRLSGRDMLAVSCFFIGVTCGIEGNRLIVAPAGKYAGLTGAEPLQLPAADTLVGNVREMPAGWRQEFQNTVDFQESSGSTFAEFLKAVEDRTQLRFQITESAAGFQGASYSLTGSYKLGDLFVPMILANNMEFSYDPESQRLLVGHDPGAQ